MKFARTLGLVLGAAIVPTIAMADAPIDPYDPQPTPAPSTTTTTTVVTPAPQPQTTTVVTPAPAPQPQTPPVVFVNPDPPTRTIVASEPESTEVYSAWNAPLFATGAFVFAGSYGASAIVAASSDHPGADRLYVPVAGPWLALNDWGDCPIERQECDSNTTDKVLLVASGVFQGAGVIGMVSGLLSPTHTTVYSTSRVAKRDTKATVTPTANGLAVLGTF
jgi:hypothetical protein